MLHENLLEVMSVEIVQAGQASSSILAFCLGHQSVPKIASRRGQHGRLSGTACTCITAVRERANQHCQLRCVCAFSIPPALEFPDFAVVSHYVLPVATAEQSLEELIDL